MLKYLQDFQFSLENHFTLGLAERIPIIIIIIFFFGILLSVISFHLPSPISIHLLLSLTCSKVLPGTTTRETQCKKKEDFAAFWNFDRGTEGGARERREGRACRAEPSRENGRERWLSE